MLDGKRGLGLLIGKEDIQKYRIVSSDVFMKVKSNFCEVIAAEMTALEKLKSLRDTLFKNQHRRTKYFDNECL